MLYWFNLNIDTKQLCLIMRKTRSIMSQKIKIIQWKNFVKSLEKKRVFLCVCNAVMLTSSVLSKKKKKEYWYTYLNKTIKTLFIKSLENKRVSTRCYNVQCHRCVPSKKKTVLYWASRNIPKCTSRFKLKGFVLELKNSLQTLLGDFTKHSFRSLPNTMVIKTWCSAHDMGRYYVMYYELCTASVRVDAVRLS